jgi:protoporphyrinogen oxidase
MTNDAIAVLGTGMAGFGAAHMLRSQGVPFVCYDQNASCGGHARSFRYQNGFIFDDGPHISFTTNEHVKKILADNVRGREENRKLTIDNYWRGYRIPHPVHCNLRGLPSDLVIKIIEDFVSSRADFSHRSRLQPEVHETGGHHVSSRQTYAEWLVGAYGKTFAETFPSVYGRKYHTTTMDQLTTDWIGPRMYRPRLEEILRGALSQSAPDVHYIQTYRYPSEGGFGSYLESFATQYEVRLNHRLVGLDPVAKILRFANGAHFGYSAVISSIALPDLIPLIDNVPGSVIEASRQLAFSSVILVNIGIARSDVSETAITYFYDEDVLASRVNLPHLLSPNNAPPGCGSIQAEVYFSDKYQPLRVELSSVIEAVIADLRRCGFIREDDSILMKEGVITRYANVIYDAHRAGALAAVRGFLDDVGILSCGRYGKWDHSWTDESFIGGEESATKALNR